MMCSISKGQALYPRYPGLIYVILRATFKSNFAAQLQAWMLLIPLPLCYTCPNMSTLETSASPFRQTPDANTTPPPIALSCILGMLCTLVAVVFARLAYGLVIPAMREDLNLNYSQAANLGTVTATAYLFLLLYAGIFAGRYG